MIGSLAALIPLPVIVFALVGGPVAMPPADTPSQLHSYAIAAVTSDQAASVAACDHLRANGPAGLDALLTEHRDVLARGAADPRWTRVTAAIDRVAAQKDAFASRLYWYTDLEEAKAAAKASGKPILSLRMLGRLDEDLSCANSRYFRTALYADPKVSTLLRERFVLHWESERPAPRVTIDFGDGRKLERTVTGNSVHYVLDADGRPVDAIPGLEGAGMFRAELSEDAELERSLRGLTPAERATRLSKHHALKRAVLSEEWPAFLVDAPPAPDAARPPSARTAAPLAYSKMMSQASLLRTLTPGPLPAGPGANDPGFARLVAAHADEARLDPACIALMRLEIGPGTGAPEGATGEKFAALVRSFEDAIAHDQATNEYVLHARIHGWFARSAPEPLALSALNQRVYDELFLTPASDPWLGLVSGDAYSGIDRGGVVPGGQAR